MWMFGQGSAGRSRATILEEEGSGGEHEAARVTGSGRQREELGIRGV